MPYKNIEGQRINYYKNRDKKIAYQREYDKKNKERKKIQDAKRYGTERYRLINPIRAYTHKHYFLILLEKYKGCQICGSIDKLEIHHIRYTKDINDCLLLCQDCHKKLHRKYLNTLITS